MPQPEAATRQTWDKLPCAQRWCKVTWRRGGAGHRAERPQHGVSDDAILHAFNNPILAEDLDEGLTMLIGADPAGNLLEIGVVSSDEGPVIVHAMSARPKYRR